MTPNERGFLAMTFIMAFSACVGVFLGPVALAAVFVVCGAILWVFCDV